MALVSLTATVTDSLGNQDQQAAAFQVEDGGNIGPSPRPGVDQRAEIQAWLDAPFDGSVLTLVGVFRCEDTITLTGRNNLTLLGGAHLYRTALIGNTGTPGGKQVWHPQLRLTDCHDCNLYLGGLHSVGLGVYSTTYESEHALQVRGGSNVIITIDDIERPGAEWCNVTHHEPGSGVHVEGTNLTIRGGGAWTAAGRQGLSVTGRIDGLTFENLDLGNAPRSLLDVEIDSPSDYARNVMFRNSEVAGFGTYLLANGGQGTSDGITLENITTPWIKIKVGQPLDAEGNPQWTRFNLAVRGCHGLLTREQPSQPIVQATGLTGFELTGNDQVGPVPVPYGGDIRPPIVHEGNDWQ